MGLREGCWRQNAATEQQIDRLVYALYGLTEEEIAIVEAQYPPLPKVKEPSGG